MDKLRHVIAFCSIVGIVAMSYLLWLHYAPVQTNGGVLCTIGDKVSCLDVNKSVYSSILGIPLSALGLAYFIGVLGLVSLFSLSSRQYSLLVLGSIALLGPSLYLTAIEIFVLSKICLYCELSKLMMFGIIATAWKLSGVDRPDGNKIFLAVGVALLLAMLTYYLQV